MTASTPGPDGRPVLQRVVFPAHADNQDLALYLDPESWASVSTQEDPTNDLARRRGFGPANGDRTPLRLTEVGGRSYLRGRRSLELPAHASVSLATYFNAFPASYWSAWTSLTEVTLRVRTLGAGTVIVFRSNARGVAQRVDAVGVQGESVTEFDLPFTSFLDGGWLWFDLVAGEDPMHLVEAEWLAPIGHTPRSTGTATIAITTMNRAAYCSALLTAIGSDPEALTVLDRVIVVDQGSTPLRRHPSYPNAERALGGRLEVIEQPNLGGSGGFSRGMLETARAGDSEYVLLLDDDAAIEPEGIRRAVAFANHAREPMIVGGHMLDMFDRTKLHAFAEGIRWSSFMWGPTTPTRHDLGEANLRQTPWLHRRYDVDYNGWWMSLIPVSVVEAIGLSLPVFIKWDDAEYSLRASEHGVPTVTLPGAAVWHVSWVDKDDSHDWQAFYHARNRLIAALLHSPEPRGGRLARANLADDLKHLLTMDYATVALRHEAIRNVFRGPERLHGELASTLERVRSIGAEFPEWDVIRDPARLTAVPTRSDASDGASVATTAGPRGLGLATWLLLQVIRHAFVRPSPDATARPASRLAYADARWFEVPNHDSVLISNAEGSGATWHVRDPRQFRRQLIASVRLNLAYRRHWDRLRRRYRAALPALVSPGEWQRTFDARR